MQDLHQRLHPDRKPRRFRGLQAGAAPAILHHVARFTDDWRVWREGPLSSQPRTARLLVSSCRPAAGRRRRRPVRSCRRPRSRSGIRATAGSRQWAAEVLLAPRLQPRQAEAGHSVGQGRAAASGRRPSCRGSRRNRSRCRCCRRSRERSPAPGSNHKPAGKRATRAPGSRC